MCFNTPPRRIVVVSKRERCRSVYCLKWMVVVSVGHVAGLGSASSTCPDVRVRCHAVNVHGHSCICYRYRIVNDDHMGPPAKLVRNQARDIKASAGPDPIIHSEVPSHLFATHIVSAWLTLEENPSLPTWSGSGIRITVIDRTLPGGGLVTCRIEPRFDGERLRIRRVQGGIPRNLSSGGEIEKLRAIPVAGQRGGKGMHHRQIVGGIARRSQTAAVPVDGSPASVIIEPIIRPRPVAEDRGLIVGALCRDRQQREGRENKRSREEARNGRDGQHRFLRPFHRVEFATQSEF